MEADAALVRADGAVALHTEAAVHLNFSTVVHPGDAEDDDALRLDDALQDFLVHELGVGGDIRCHALHDFADGLVEFGFSGVAGDDLPHETFDVIAGKVVHKRGIYTLLIRKYID